jgi:phage-related protein
MALAITFAGLAIDGVFDWGEDLPSRVQSETFPRRHGSIVQSLAFLGPRTVTLSGEVVKADETSLKSYLNALSQTLTDRGRDRLFLRNDNRYLNAIKTAFSYRFQGGRLPASIAQFSISFLADDPFWYNSTTDSVLTSNIVASPTVIAVTNNGGSKTPPLIEIKALGSAVTGVKISNGSTGLFISYTGTINAGATLSIDCADFKVLANGGNGLNLIGTGSSIDMQLEPGLNNFVYEGAVTGVDVNILWLPRWS